MIRLPLPVLAFLVVVCRWYCVVERVCAQSRFDRLYPHAIRLGVPGTIHVEGEIEQWPVEVWTDRADLQVEPALEKGQLTVRCTSDALPGIAWVWLRAGEVTSRLLPLLIINAPVMAEDEAHDGTLAREGVPLPAAMVGKLQHSGEVDVFDIKVAQPGALRVRVFGHRVLQSPMDAVLQLCDAQGHVLCQNDDTWGLDPEIIVNVKEPGRYQIRLFAFPETPNSTIGFAGGADFAYCLMVEENPYVEYFLPLIAPSAAADIGTLMAIDPRGRRVATGRLVAPTAVSPPVAVDPAQPWAWQWLVTPPTLGRGLGTQPISVAVENEVENTVFTNLPQAVCGILSEEGEVDRFRMLAQKGMRYQAVVESSRWGLPTDPQVRIVTVDGQSIADADDISRQSRDASVEFSSDEDQELQIEVRDAIGHGGPQHAYALVIAEARPDFELQLDASSLVVVAGGQGKVKLRITRLHGFSESIALTPIGLPSGVTMEPTEVVAEKGATQDVELVFTAVDEVKPFAGWVRLRGKGVGGERKESAAAEVGETSPRSRAVGASTVSNDEDGQTVDAFRTLADGVRAAYVPLRPEVRLDGMWLVVLPQQ
ncbi:MAG: serine protease [Pirellulaceae bacterium]|nr:MAG: serine protease [Pirellulaceae bacterium]